MKNKINYFDSPNQRRQSKSNVKWMTFFLGFDKPMSKVFKQIKKNEKRKEYK